MTIAHWEVEVLMKFVIFKPDIMFFSCSTQQRALGPAMSSDQQTQERGKPNLKNSKNKYKTKTKK
jgi:hypothetical protein